MSSGSGGDQTLEIGPVGRGESGAAARVLAAAFPDDPATSCSVSCRCRVGLRGVIDRFLVTPVRRTSLISGRLGQGALTIVIQSLTIVGLALITGASFDNGIGGIAVLIAVPVLVGSAFGCLSIGLALLVCREETVIAAVQFLLLPLSFTSVTFMQKDLMPAWMQSVSDYNPLNWAVESGRAAVTASSDWAEIALRAGLLVAFLVLCGWFAVSAFRTYQRSV